jgi:L-amino acid N-acyltransferase YncA
LTGILAMAIMAIVIRTGHWWNGHPGSAQAAQLPLGIREARLDDVAEFSVYVTSTERGRRVGDALMAAFLPACEAAGFWKVLSRIFPENAASRALCARHGFREVGMYERHARLDGVWRDVVIVERLLAPVVTP